MADNKRILRDGSDIKTLEHSTIRVPYEILNKKYRSSQRTMDREVGGLTQSLNQLRRCVTLDEANKTLDNVVTKLNVVKRKADDAITDEQEAANLCKRRIEHLKDGLKSWDPVGLSIWKNQRLERLLVDHFLRSGYYSSAEKLADLSKLRDLTNVDVFLVYQTIMKSLEAKDTSKCLSWCFENRSRLRKIDSTLEFKLRQQEFIELVRQDRRLDAIYHARKYLSTTIGEDCVNSPNCQKRFQHHSVADQQAAVKLARAAKTAIRNHQHRFSRALQPSLTDNELFRSATSGLGPSTSSTNNPQNIIGTPSKSQSSCSCLRNNQLRKEIENTMGLLAYPKDTDKEPYRSLLADSRWPMIMKLFKEDTYKLFQFNYSSILSVTLQAGLSALKTPHCVLKSGQRDPDCPICNPLLNSLAKGLPLPHSSQSKLICSISGQALNENNPPLLLPNGYIYGELSLKAMSEKNNGQITCPRTRQSFRYDEAQKVYIM